MRRVVITDRAKFNIKNLLDYLEISWNVKVREKYADKLFKSMKILQGNPEVFPVAKHSKKIRKCVISKQSTLYYSFNQSTIVILSLFDTRQNPDKINQLK